MIFHDFQHIFKDFLDFSHPQHRPQHRDQEKHLKNQFLGPVLPPNCQGSLLQCFSLKIWNIFFSWFSYFFMVFWTHFGDFLWNYWQNFIDFWWFFDFLPTLEDSFSMTTDPISKSLGIINIYSLRAVDCAMFRRCVAKITFSFLSMKIWNFEILTLSSPPTGENTFLTTMWISCWIWNTNLMEWNSQTHIWGDGDPRKVDIQKSYIL